MKKTVTFLLVLLSVFLTDSLSAQEKFISGKLTGFKDGDKIALYNPQIMKTLDSAYIKDGNFRLKNPLGETPEIMFLIANDDLVFIPFIAGENMEISGDKKDFKFNLTVKGSKFHKEKEILDNQTRNYDIERDSLEKYFDDSDTSEAYLALQKIKLKRLQEIHKATTEITLNHIKQHSNSYYSLMNLSYYFDSFSKTEIRDLYNKADKNLQQSVYGKTIKTYLEIGKILKEGDAFFDFEAKGQDGKTHKLSEFKDNYILLDFNETYCGPCVASVPEMKKLAVDFKDKVKIVNFCADKPENIWKIGLNRDKPDWFSLWDGKGTQGPTVLKYGVRGFPTFVLINQTGIIVKIVSGYEKGILEKMLKENIK